MQRALFQNNRKINEIVSSIRSSEDKSSHYYIRVKDGDTYWSIAQQHYGNSNLWTLLIKTNPNISPFRPLPIGEELLIIRSKQAILQILEEE